MGGDSSKIKNRDNYLGAREACKSETPCSGLAEVPDLNQRPVEAHAPASAGEYTCRMMTTYRIYGNSDERPKLGFPTPEHFQAYIGKEIFSKNQGRYRYSETYFAEVIVLSRKGKAYGHFELEGWDEPTDFDDADYDNTKRVFLVKRSSLYENAVRLNELDLSPKQRGRPISHTEFNRIIRAAGEITSVTADDIYDRRYCKVCFNENGWVSPTGSAEEGNTYYSANGFGHEEWLFRYEWCINGMKYGFLQPFTNRLSTWQGKTFALKLYTIHKGITEFVGTISKVYVPEDDELAATYSKFVENGWLDIMKDEVRAVDGNVDALGGNVPNLVLNARFDPSDVFLFKRNERPLIPPNSAPNKAIYYNLYHDDDATYEQTTSDPDKLTVKKREEVQYKRVAQEGTTVDPVHVRLQNRLYDWLCDRHGAKAVGYEIDNVDLRVTLPNDVTFFEIKTNATAKLCIRNALGQLIEYTSYPAAARANRWIVVGDKKPVERDLTYLKHLRDTFDLRIFYARFDWLTNALGEPL